MIAVATGAPLVMAVAMVVVGAVCAVLDARRHEHRSGKR